MSQDAPRVSFGLDETLFEEGQTGDTAYVMVHGGVDLVKRGQAAGRSFVAENVTKPGTAFGLIPLIDNGPRMMSAVATNPDTICELITAEDLENRINASPAFVRNLMRILTFRFPRHDRPFVPLLAFHIQ
ncbi:Crp/Fnr family transcriptional regulator [Magnetovibrio sp. PR-2]|uniref:Crp/Fnr family transcriptional regulator n=1 Tax=Magnetovibrio sp. PR-2 TaxID=3120356 RepID=UPI002FCE553E